MIIQFATTYFFHSTILLVVALLARFVVRRAALREILLRAALFGGAVTAAINTSGIMPALIATQPDGSRLERVEEREFLNVTASAVATAELRRVPDAESLLPISGATTVPPWRDAVLALWLGGALFFLLRLARGHLSLRRQLRGRSEVRAPEVIDALSMLAQACRMKHTVHLTESAALDIPLALGRGEICLPIDSSVRRDAAQLRTVLAHETAHLTRSDPLWFSATDIVAALFWWQPLNWVIRAQLRHLAELLCDDAVIQATGERRTFAACLVQLAQQLEGGARSAPSVAAGLGNKTSPFMRRIARVLHGDEAAAAPWERVAFRASAALGLGAMLVFFPIGRPERPGRLINEEIKILRGDADLGGIVTPPGPPP